MRLEFVKCHGSGNDFPLIDARGIVLDDAAWGAVARALGDRRGPVGSDGLLLMGAGDGRHRFSMRMFNSDGSEAETCLNGLRCVARMGFAAFGVEEAQVRLKTSSATVAHVADLAPGVYTVRETAGPASLDVASWPMTGPMAGATPGATSVIEAPIAALPSRRAFTAVAMPNPHLVTFVDVVDEAELVAVGTACEAAPAWLPNRANVSFVEIRGADLFVRTFERGVGLTDSCGSAMAASTYAAGLTGRTAFGHEAVVFNRGGMVRGVAGADAMVSLSGNATWEWAGSATIDLATGTAGDLVVARHFNDEIAAWAGVVEGIAA